MLILPKHNAIFYHVYKVAGTSIRNALLPYALKRQIAGQLANHALSVARLPKIRNPLYSYHPSLLAVRDKLGDSYYDYYRFAFVRAPLNWQKSLYFFMLKKQHLPGNSRIKGMDFDQYLNWRMDNEMRFQSDMLYQGDENLVNDIFRFENIQEDFRAVANRLGIDAKLPYLNKAGAGRDAPVSPATLRRFKDVHEEEYAKLGYDIETV